MARCAPGSGLVLKPMTTASEADASSTSDSLMSPAPSRRMLIRTSLVFSRSSACRMAPSEPCTSVLSTTRSSLTSADWIWAEMSSSVKAVLPSLPMVPRAVASAISRAAFSSSTTRRMSPASGRSLQADDLDRGRGLGQLHALAGGVLQGADAAVGARPPPRCRRRAACRSGPARWPRCRGPSRPSTRRWCRPPGGSGWPSGPAGRRPAGSSPSGRPGRSSAWPTRPRRSRRRRTPR